MKRSFQGSGLPVAVLAMVLLAMLAALVGCGDPCDALHDCCAGLPHPTRLACQKAARSGDPDLCRRTLAGHRALGYCVAVADDGPAPLDPFDFDDEYDEYDEEDACDEEYPDDPDPPIDDDYDDSNDDHDDSSSPWS